MLFAEKWGTTPFDVLNQDIDDLILIANNMIRKGNKDTNEQPKSTAKPKKDAFWDF